MLYNATCYNSPNRNSIGSVTACLIHLAVRRAAAPAPTSGEWWRGSFGSLTMEQSGETCRVRIEEHCTEVGTGRRVRGDHAGGRQLRRAARRVSAVSSASQDASVLAGRSGTLIGPRLQFPMRAVVQTGSDYGSELCAKATLRLRYCGFVRLSNLVCMRISISGRSYQRRLTFAEAWYD
jgi:hypothetical protein